MHISLYENDEKTYDYTKCYTVSMGWQLDLFKRKSFAGILPSQQIEIKKPTGESTVVSTIPAYYVYLQSGGYAKSTPDQFVSDIKAFGLFMQEKKLHEIATQDVQGWVSELRTTKYKNYSSKTISRKISTINNYFNWLVGDEVIEHNPAQQIYNKRITSPLPDILFESECEALQHAASTDPRTYLLIVLFLETGMKKEELFMLQVTHFDYSNKYAPEVWIKHEGKKVKKDRKLKLPQEIVPAFREYVEKYGITDQLFPYTQRFIEMLLHDVARMAQVKKKVNASILRDTFAVRQLRRGESMELVLLKLGLSESTWEDAKEKYVKLSSKGI